MRERQPVRMQRLPLKRDWMIVLRAPRAWRRRDISLLPDQAMAVQCRLDANLILPAGHQGHFDERRSVEALDDTVPADGFLRPRIARRGRFLDERPSVPD